MKGAILKGKYQVLELLARGGMGDIYLVSELAKPKKIWVLKQIVWDTCDSELDTVLFRQFQNEGRLLTRLKHPMLPKIKEYFRENDNHFIIREYIPGLTLQEFLNRELFPPALKQVRDWGLQICNLLEYLHELTPPVIVNDITPGNLVLTPKGDLKMIDLGIARIMGDDGSGLPPGTPGYTAPEALENGNISPQSDIFELGVCLYVLAGKNPPYRMSEKSEKPVGSKEFDAIIRRAAENDPARRYPRVTELKAALQNLRV